MKKDKEFKQSEQEKDKVFKNSENDTKDLIGKIPKGKLYKVVFKHNRSFEVWIPAVREHLRFEAHIANPVSPLDKDGQPKYKDGVPEVIIKDNQFQSSLKYFNVMEVI